MFAEYFFAELYEGQAFADEVITWLCKQSFRLSGVYNMGYDGEGREIQADFLFTRGGL